MTGPTDSDRPSSPGMWRTDAELGWAPAAPEPFYAPPRIRSIIWAALTGKPKPQWRAVRSDPNPAERRWRRG